MSKARGIRHKESISPNLAAKLEAIPVWPEEASLSYLGHKYGVAGLPADAPIGEDEGWVCYPTVKDKDRYMSKIYELVGKYHQKNKALRVKEKDRT